MLAYKGELNDPDNKECQELFGRDVGAFGQGVGEVLPRRAKYTSKHDGQDGASVEGLNTDQ